MAQPSWQRKPALGLVALLILITVGYLLSGQSGNDSTAHPTQSTAADTESGLAVISEATLPEPARDVLTLIGQGGPFRYAQDGAEFGNREGLLPDRPGGYYHEYTVDTAGSDDRGARRIITGSDGEIYYTADHYDSFARVVVP